jgi:NitT/TauT family transport system ATP-binding protein
LDAITREHLNRELLRIQQLKQQTIFMVTHDINEAVFLSNRVLTLSSRPGEIRCDISVPLPYPRTDALLTDPIFLALVRQVRAEIDHEASGATYKTFD